MWHARMGDVIWSRVVNGVTLRAAGSPLPKRPGMKCIWLHLMHVVEYSPLVDSLKR